MTRRKVIGAAVDDPRAKAYVRREAAAQARP